MTKVSVIITAHNYAKHLPQAIDSVLSQTFDDFECIVVNDGSTDHTDEVLKVYEGNEKLKVLELTGVGLARASNHGIKNALGEYIIRLDADDYFDESILVVLANILERHPNYDMVYPDYYRVDKHGKIIDLVRQPKINDEVTLLDRSALAAGALYRKSCWEILGGYSEELRFQEDYDFWIRFIDRFTVYNVQLPLMYYRQHQGSMSTNTGPRMAARRYVKHNFVEQNRDLDGKEVLCVLPMVATSRFKQKLPLVELGGKPLMAFAIEEALSIPFFDRVIVDTEDEEIAAAARALGADVPFLRPRDLSRLDVGPTEVLRNLVSTLHREEHYDPDMILMSYYTFPFMRAEQMAEAIDTLLIHDCDSVISVGVNIRFHWQQGEHGLKPVLYARKTLTDQKETTYEERGGIFALKTSNLKTDEFLGKSVSFIEVSEAEGLRIDSDYSHWIAEQQLSSGVAQAFRDEAEAVKAKALRPKK